MITATLLTSLTLGWALSHWLPFWIVAVLVVTVNVWRGIAPGGWFGMWARWREINLAFRLARLRGDIPPGPNTW